MRKAFAVALAIVLLAYQIGMLTNLASLIGFWMIAGPFIALILDRVYGKNVQLRNNLEVSQALSRPPAVKLLGDLCTAPWMLLVLGILAALTSFVHRFGKQTNQIQIF